MKKIGIVTLNSNDNYGNKLQNYALKTVCCRYGFQVDTLWFDDEYNSIKFFVKRLLFFVKKYRREMKFENFTRMYLNRCVFDGNHNNYDYFIAGSDQIWNYKFKGVQKRFNNYFLMFSPKKKNISYAASIGVDTISESYIEKFKDGINNINCVSVRENEAKEVLKNITDRDDIQVVLDPTMLLPKTEWEKIMKKPKKLKNKKFILNYFLGELSNEKRNGIDEFAHSHDCIVINILSKNDPYYLSDPSEFLYLEKNAFLICTDSFHASVFAILFNTPFVVFDRAQIGVSSMNSRINTLLSTFHLEHKKCDENEISSKYLDNNYDLAYDILKNRIEDSIQFIKKSLNIDE